MSMRVFLHIITFICIFYGIYKIAIRDQDGLSTVAFIFGVLTFLITLVPTEAITTTGDTQNPVNIETEEEWISEKEDTEIESEDVKDSTEESSEADNTIVNNSSGTKIEGNQFSGNLLKEGEVHSYEYIASVSGVYRFDFTINDDQKNYIFIVKTSNNKEKANTYYSHKGVNVSLDKGEKYKIIVKQHEGYCSYVVNIGIPKEVQTINTASFLGSIVYTGQEDRYIYTAPITGTYRFDFISDNTGNNYRFKMYASDKTEKANTYYSKNGATVNLVQGEQYTIYVEQYSGFLNYTINIGIPNEIQVINGNSFSGNLIYIGKIDQYTYIAPITGTYRFDFISDNTGNNYRFKMYASDKTEKANTYYSKNGATVDLVQGEQYTIYVEQYSGFLNYTISIGIPNEIQTINGNNFSGSLLYTDQVDRFMYTAPITGTYRFDFSSDNTNSNYIFRMYALDKSEKADTYYSKNGVTVNLVEGEMYTIEVVQYSDIGNYIINIGVPSAPIEVNGNCISGNIMYVDQENIYIYRAPITGEYVFDFQISDVNTSYKFNVITSMNLELISAYSSKATGKAQLEVGQVYTIKVIQNKGFPTYTININMSTE